MTVLFIVGIIAAWAVVALLILVILSRTVSRADEENEVSSMRRMVQAEDRGPSAPEPRKRWQQPTTGGVSTRPHS